MCDYKSIGLVDIRGRSNYKCDMRADYTCEEGYASGCPYKATLSCPSVQAEMRAASSNLVVTNYDKWTASRRFGTGMSHFEQVIFDEGHDAPNAIARAMQINISHTTIEDELQLDYPMSETSMLCWRLWSGYARDVAQQKLLEWKVKCEEVSAPKASWVKQVFHFRNLARKLAILATCRPDDWIVDETETGFQFDPIRPARYAESTLLLRIPKIIVISATLRPKTMYMLGLSKEKFDFHEFPSDFDKKRCPIYWVPTMRVDARQPDLSMLWVRLDQIIAKRRDRKGIIHTISYARRDEIMGRSRFGASFLINAKGTPPTGMVEQFKGSRPGTILVSPSVGTGYDFPLSDCEFQFLCKIPFPDSRSKIVKARQDDDPEFGAYVAMQTMVQAFGRGMRSQQDQCENFIGDDHLSWFLPKYRHLAPKWFSHFFQRVDILPQPPKPLEAQ